MKRLLRLAPAVLLTACATGTTGIEPRGIPAERLPLELERFMGDWYVIAHIPTPPEEDAVEAVESYTLRDDGSIDVRFRFCEGALDGPPRELRMSAWVADPETNAEWRVRPVWPLRFRYQILELDPEFRTTVVVHPSGGHAWVMARSPEFPQSRLDAITARLATDGYDTSKLRRVPHADGSCRTSLESRP